MKSALTLMTLVFGLGSTVSSYAVTDNSIIVDVRTAEKFSEGPAKGAINIDVLQPDFKEVENVGSLNQAIQKFGEVKKGEL